MKSKPKCTDCWENRSKWIERDGVVWCKVCGRYIAKVPRDGVNLKENWRSHEQTT